MTGACTVSPVADHDVPAIQALIATVVRHSVARSDAEARFLIQDIGGSLDEWRDNPADMLHLKCSCSGCVVGVVLVKEYWNLTNLFVAPDHQGRGIGRLLLEAALDACRSRSPRGALLLNSSTIACGFYERLGFRQTGPGRDRPGGCVPYRYDFAAPSAASP